jgi:hypothetical protein
MQKTLRPCPTVKQRIEINGKDAENTLTLPYGKIGDLNLQNQEPCQEK